MLIEITKLLSKIYRIIYENNQNFNTVTNKSLEYPIFNIFRTKKHKINY